MQYTLRKVPRAVDATLRRRAQREAKSLNEVALEALAAGAGIGSAAAKFHDLDSLAGTWREDSEFDKALTQQDRVDAGLWK
ncbi:MAG: hypothetical protein FJ388_07350 [Verrucomicrobia bacterium]|nr:hypothetical protein [Verrucomicrobiota bacterium]